MTMITGLLRVENPSQQTQKTVTTTEEANNGMIMSQQL